MTKNTNEHGFISAVYERKTHEDLHTLDLPKGKRAIGTKWIFRNKKDKRGIVTRNKARLVAQGYTQEEGIDYDEVLLLTRREAIRSMIGSLMYLTSSRLDIMFAIDIMAVQEANWWLATPPFTLKLRYVDAGQDGLL
ncbi:putative ribonuclease H-like domain-containing protein [Tanacetum coccineum]